MNINKSTLFWACAIVTGINAMVSAGFSIAALLGRGPTDTYAMYATARSIPLAIVVLGLIAARSRSGIAVMALVMGLVQACDAVVGILAQDAGKTIGPAVLAVATLVLLGLMRRAEKAAA